MAFLRVRRRSPDLVSVSLRSLEVAGNCIEHTISLLCEKKISLGCSRKVRDTVSSVQQCRALIMWQLGVWLDFQRLVVAEVTANSSDQYLDTLFRARTFCDLPVIVVLDLPTTWGVDVLAIAAFHVIGDDNNVVRFVAQQFLKQSPDDRDHSG